MAERDVRDLIVDAWAGWLRRSGAPHPQALAGELAAIAEGHGVRLTRPAHLHDPAADWRVPLPPNPVADVDNEHPARRARAIAEAAARGESAPADDTDTGG